MRLNSITIADSIPVVHDFVPDWGILVDKCFEHGQGNTLKSALECSK
jgi:hypothetical protein